MVVSKQTLVGHNSCEQIMVELEAKSLVSINEMGSDHRRMHRVALPVVVIDQKQNLPHPHTPFLQYALH